jgi:NADPH2:quinone reductase
LRASGRHPAFGGPENLVIREIPEPEPRAGHAVIEVKAFGLNHAELHMRKGEWAEIADVSGIERARAERDEVPPTS